MLDASSRDTRALRAVGRENPRAQAGAAARFWSACDRWFLAANGLQREADAVRTPNAERRTSCQD
jgi:hypothetical protein